MNEAPVNDVTGRVTKQSSQQQCGVLRSSRTRPYLSVRRFNTTTERSGLLPLRLPSDTKEISRTRLTLRLRSNGTIATARQYDPTAFAARATDEVYCGAEACHFPWQGASYRKRSTPWPTKRPRLTMTRSILRRSFAVALVCLDSRRSGWI